MPIELVTTVGSALANSYADLDYAKTYFAQRPQGLQWTGTDDVKATALLAGLKRLDALELIGRRVDTTQALAFPRTANTLRERRNRAGETVAAGFYDKSDRLWDDDEIPAPIKDAQCELALLFITQTTLADTPDMTSQNVTAFSTDGVSIHFKDGDTRSLWEQGKLPSAVVLPLLPFLASRQLELS